MTTANATFTVQGWDEQTFEERDPGKLTIASVQQAVTGDIEGSSDVRWIMAYTAPKRVKRAPKYGPPALVSDNMVTTHWPMSRDAQRFANWRKATEAARQAREGR